MSTFATRLGCLAALGGWGACAQGPVEAPADSVRLAAAAPAPRVEWLQQFGSLPGSATETATAVAVDDTGLTLVGGQTNGVLGAANAGGVDAFLRLVDANGNETWTQQFGTAGTDTVTGVALGATGVYAVGATDGRLGEVHASLSDAFVRKHSLAGAPQWTDQFGSGSTDAASAITVVSSVVEGVAVDEVFVVGVTFSVIEQGQTSSGDQDAWIRKYRSTGVAFEVVWTHQYGTSGTETASDIAAAGGALFVSGSTSGAFAGETSSGNADAYLARFDPATGASHWTRQLGTPGPDSGASVSASGEHVWITGAVVGALPDCGCAAQGTDAFVRRYDRAGGVGWTRQFGSAGLDVSSSLSSDGTGIVLVGQTNGTLAGQTSAGDFDAFARRLDLDGNEIWTRQFGTAAADNAADVAGGSASPRVVGFTDGALIDVTPGGRDAFLRGYDSGGAVLFTRQIDAASPLPAADLARRVIAHRGQLLLAGRTGGPFPGQASAGLLDAYLQWRTLAGKVLDTRQFGTTTQDILGDPAFDNVAEALAADTSGIYVGGGTAGAFAPFTSAGNADAFLRKYSHAGAVLWTRQFGTAFGDTLAGATADDGGVVVGGTTGAALPGQISAGLADGFVRRYDRDGQEIWTVQFGTAAGETIYDMVASPDGIYIVGSTAGHFPGAQNLGIIDAFVHKVDRTGQSRWTRQFGTAAADIAFAAAVDESGMYVTGQRGGDGSAADRDMFVRKFDHDGNLVWEDVYEAGGPGETNIDRSRALAVYGSALYVGGHTLRASYDGFILKYEKDGIDVGGHRQAVRLWTFLGLATSGNDFVSGLTVDGSGVYVCGMTFGDLGCPSPPAPGQPACPGEGDSFVAKLKD
jgi:hypothetical protein